MRSNLIARLDLRATEDRRNEKCDDERDIVQAGAGALRPTATGGATARVVAYLDAALSAPFAHRHLPQVVWAFDPRLGACRRVRWSNTNEPWALRRTALAIARQEASSVEFELN